MDIQSTKKFQVLIIFLFPLFLFAQTVDSSNHYNYNWNSLALHAGVGLQRSAYLEIGTSYIYHNFNSRQGFVNGILFTSFEWTPIKNIYGIKVGAEYGYNLSMLCIDLKYQFRNSTKDLVITPKIGLGLGLLSLYYGYTISTSKYPFPSIGKHQFSMTINFTRKYFEKINTKTK